MLFINCSNREKTCFNILKSLQKEGDIRVNAIAPGLIDTPLTDSTGEDPSWTTDFSIIKRVGKPEEIADAVLFFLSDKSSYITGQVLAVDGGFTLK